MDPRYVHIGEIEDRVIEECSELIQVLCKIKRFGYDSHHPTTKERNRDLLLAEISDVNFVIGQLLRKLHETIS